MKIKSLRGSRALVTGSTAGIGRAIARELAGHGVAVAVHGRDAQRAEVVVEEIRTAGGNGEAFAVDLLDAGAGRRLVEEVISRMGGIELLVNCAGRASASPSLDTDMHEWSSVLALMLTAPFECAQAAAGHMLAAGRGVILNIGSIAGHVGLPERTAYCVAKHGIVGLTKALASEWAGDGIRVLSVDPGYVETDLVRSRLGGDGGARHALEDRTPTGRLGRPEEVARLSAFLLSDEASYMTGASVLIDGGWTANGSA